MCDKCKDGRPWNSDTQLYVKSTYIAPTRGCFAFMFTNRGNDAATVNGMVIFPSATPNTALGDSRTLSAHKDDLYKGNITLSFAGVGNAPLVEIVQLFYTDVY
jgi:hypothetical protein